MSAETGFWLVTGTPVDQPYRCRCAEAKYGTCSPAWCPCAGRDDLENVGPDCCGNWTTPADHVEAMTAWRIKRMQQG